MYVCAYLIAAKEKVKFSQSHIHRKTTDKQGTYLEIEPTIHV